MGNVNLSSISVRKSTQLPILVSCLGDSILNNDGGNGTWFEATIIASKGKYRKVVNSAIGGNTIAQMLARYDTDIAPFYCHELWLQCGTNDVTDGSDADALAYFNDLCALIDKVKSTGVLVRLISIPPREDHPQCVQKFRNVQSIVARKKGIAFHDIWSDYFHATTGAWKNGSSDCADGVHPDCGPSTEAVQKLLKALSFVDGVYCDSLPMSNNAFGGLYSNPLFLTDTNADGCADGVEFWGGTASLIPGSIGKKQKLTVTTGINAGMKFLTSSAIAGSKIKVSYAIESEFTASKIQNRIFFTLDGTDTTQLDIVYTKSALYGVVEYEFTIPVGSNGFWCSTTLLALGASQTGSVSISQAQAWNLTVLGLA